MENVDRTKIIVIAVCFILPAFWLLIQLLLSSLLLIVKDEIIWFSFLSLASIQKISAHFNNGECTYRI
jgi:hypothetical protein